MGHVHHAQGPGPEGGEAAQGEHRRHDRGGQDEGQKQKRRAARLSFHGLYALLVWMIVDSFL